MARNPENNEKMKEERRERILLGALELFARNGLGATKISDIAKHTAMSNGLVYHYFSAKEDIFIELISIAFTRMTVACRNLQNMVLPPHEKLLHALHKLVETLRTHPSASRYHLLIVQATAADNIPQAAKEIVAEHRRIPYRVIAEIIAQGQQEKTILPGKPQDLAFFFWININGIALHQVMYGENAQCPDLSPFKRMFFPSGEVYNHA